MKRVFVTNIPVRTCTDGWVKIPDDTPEANVNEAIAIALRVDGFTPETRTMPVEGIDLDMEALNANWEFTTPLEET